MLYRFAKDLVRRSRSKCELCNHSGDSLHIYEVLHEGNLTDASHCLFICDECFEQITEPRKINPLHWHCLHQCIWSEIPVVQVMAARMLKRLSSSQFWATELLETAYIDDEVAAWAALTD